MKKTNLMLLSLVAMSGLFCSCQPKDNTLTKAEEKEGWQLLFNGQDLSEWCNFNDTVLSNGWRVVDGCIQASGEGADDSGYIVTKRKFADFELSWDWKLTHGGNSGMIYHVVENPAFAVPYVTGPEYQLIDNEGWEEVNAPEKLEEWQKLGVDYAMHLPDYSKMHVNPVGEWNNSKIVFDNGHVEHWLNGEKILEFEAWTDDWFAKKGSGKWAHAPEYGLASEGVICLQDHGDPASFKNIKIRPLPHTGGQIESLFNGKDLTGWEPCTAISVLASITRISTLPLSSSRRATVTAACSSTLSSKASILFTDGNVRWLPRVAIPAVSTSLMAADGSSRFPTRRRMS